MPASFNTIGIIGRVKTQNVKDTLKTLIDFLNTLNGTVHVEQETADSINDLNSNTLSREELSQCCDLIIVVGGDGSLLHAVHAVIEDEIPILGINRGSLGFLTDVLPTQLEKIKEIIQGQYICEERFLLTAMVLFQQEVTGQDCGLNEVAIIPDAVPHMIEFEVYIDGQFVNSQNADGIIVATPTGSTAYAMSGGGPILHPQLDAVVLVPMFPHSLNYRPIVVDGNSEICINISPNNTTSPRLSCDGRAHLTIPPGSRIIIRKKSKTLHLIHPLDYNYYETLRSKLHWGKKLNYME